MGELHSKLTAMAAIGDYIQDSELPLLWVEAAIVSEGEADKILQGRDYEGGIRTHRISFQAAWRIVMPDFLEYMNDNDKDLHKDVTSLFESKLYVALASRLDNNDFFDILKKFLDMKKMDKTFRFISNYQDMVQKLLSFTRGERTRNFTLQMAAFVRLLDDYTR